MVDPLDSADPSEFFSQNWTHLSTRWWPRKTLDDDQALDYVERTQRIRIDCPLPDETLEALTKASRRYPEKGLSIGLGPEWNLKDTESAFSGSLQGLLGFEHVRSLILYAYEATSFEVLSGFTELRDLTIGATRSARPSLEFLLRCPHIEKALFEGCGKGVDTIAALPLLKELRLKNLKAKNLEFLRRNDSIERMELLYASVTDLGPIGEMKKLRRLWVCRIRGMASEDLEPLSRRPLDMLGLNDAPHVEHLDALANSEIQHLSLDNLSGLQTLRNLRDWTELRVLGIRGSPPPDGSLVDVARNPTLRHLAIACPLSHEELRSIQAVFEGESLRYQGEYLWGVDAPPDTIAERTHL